MEFINGKMDGCTKGISKMTIGMDMGNFLMGKNACTKVIGSMDNKSNLTQVQYSQKLLKRLQVFK